MLTAADYQTVANCRETEFHSPHTINGSTRLEQISKQARILWMARVKWMSLFQIKHRSVTYEENDQRMNIAEYQHMWNHHSLVTI